MFPGSRSALGLGTTVLALACGQRQPVESIEQLDSEPAPNPAPALEKDGGPPRLIRAELDSTGRLRLQFSEELGPLEDFQPNDFRISIRATYSNPSKSKAFVNYGDFTYGYYDAPLKFQRWHQDGASLELEFTPAARPDRCAKLNGGEQRGLPPEFDYFVGIYLHYDASGIPVRDRSGEILANFGSDWVVRGRSDPKEVTTDVDIEKLPTLGTDLFHISCVKPS